MRWVQTHQGRNYSQHPAEVQMSSFGLSLQEAISVGGCRAAPLVLSAVLHTPVTCAHNMQQKLFFDQTATKGNGVLYHPMHVISGIKIKKGKCKRKLLAQHLIIHCCCRHIWMLPCGPKGNDYHVSTGYSWGKTSEIKERTVCVQTSVNKKT